MFLEATCSFTGTTTRVSQAFDCRTLTRVCAIIAADISGGTWNAKLQGSNDGVIWVDLDTASALTDDTPKLYTKADVSTRYVRVCALTADAGTLTSLSATFNAKM